MLKQIVDFLKEADCGVKFSLEDGMLNIHLEKLIDGEVKVSDIQITEDFINTAYNPDFMLGRLLYKWESEDEFYTKATG